MSVGNDIKGAIEDVGATFTILQDAGNISGEYGILEFSTQVTKPLTIEAFRKLMASYDTQMSTGDVIEFDVTDTRFLVTNMLPELFENASVYYDTVLYKCNIASGELSRPSGESWDNNSYHKETEWEVIKSDCDAMHVAALYGNDMATDEELALIGLNKNEVLISQSIGAQVLDRWTPYAGEYYMVTTIDPRRYPNVDVLIVEEDRR